MMFTNSNGRKPQTEARKYVYNVLSQMLEHELSPDEDEGWMFGGIDDVFDRQRLRKAIKAIISELKRKGQ
jgi:hypothetical protein